MDTLTKDAPPASINHLTPPQGKSLNSIIGIYASKLQESIDTLGDSADATLALVDTFGLVDGKAVQDYVANYIRNAWADSVQAAADKHDGELHQFWHIDPSVLSKFITGEILTVDLVTILEAAHAAATPNFSFGTLIVGKAVSNSLSEHIGATISATLHERYLKEGKYTEDDYAVWITGFKERLQKEQDNLNVHVIGSDEDPDTSTEMLTGFFNE